MGLGGTQGQLANRITEETIRAFGEQGIKVGPFQKVLIAAFSRGIAQALVPHLIGTTTVSGTTDITPPGPNSLDGGRIN